MAKKKKQTKSAKPKDFGNNPFSDLKGLSASGAEEGPRKTEKSGTRPAEKEFGSFADEMDMLGVKRIHSESTSEEDFIPDVAEFEVEQEDTSLSEEEIFLEAMGGLQVKFEESLHEEDAPQKPAARRMKQLKQGKLVPQATLDLHGLVRADVADKLTFFLQDAAYQGWQTVLVITGKGLHSADGEPVLRAEAERFLSQDGKKWVVEWGRAPQKFGGEGALVLFLRKDG